MRVIRANLSDAETVRNIVHSTIHKIYPKYYPEGVVQFFLAHHSMDNIKKALNTEYVLLLECNGELIGTGTLADNEIKRMFIIAEYQGRGYGRMLLDQLEQQAASRGYTAVVLDSSLPAYSLYEKRGYTQVKYNRIETENGQVLCFSTMSKALGNQQCRIDYNHKVFSTVCNTDNGEVSGETIFKYRQDGEVIWAEYSGGEILRGSLIGTTDREGNLEFCYQHINTAKQVRTGRCKSVPQLLPDGRIRLLEEWEWTNGDKSRGSSVVEELDGSTNG